MQIKTIWKMALHLGVAVSVHDVNRIADGVYSTRTATFRRGRIGGWRDDMQPQTKELFKEKAGKLLIDLGYEPDLNW